MSLRKLTIQIYSDLHLELTKCIPKINPRARYLFLAGDISRFDHPSFQEFIRYCNENWEKTFYVFGNHDYWNQLSYIQKIKRQTKDFLELNKLTNVYILDNEFVSLNEEIIVLGSTFWTKSQFSSNDEARRYFNDYNMIRFKSITDVGPHVLGPQHVNQMYFEDYSKIYEVLNTNELTIDKKIIVMTHFPPQQTNTSHPKYSLQGETVKNYFSHPNNTIKDFGNLNNILCWISGHTHYSYDFNSSEGVRLISNQMGYINEAMIGDSRFKQDGLFEIYY
jgi:predicted phosphohydrolase